MKKILGIFLLLQVLLIPNVYAKELPTISVGSFDAYIGERIVVPIEVKNNPGCSYLGIKIYYDTNSLEYVDSKLKGLNNSDMKDIVRNEDMITLYALSFTEGKSMNDNGVVAEITFNVKKNAVTSALRVEVTDFGGEDLVDYEFVKNDGLVRITDKKDLNSTEDLTQMIPPTIEGDVTWESKDESIASIDEQGNVTFSGEGSTTVTGTDPDGNVVLEKDYTVVDKEKENQKDKHSKKNKHEKGNTLIYILITLGIFFVLGSIIIFIRFFCKKEANGE